MGTVVVWMVMVGVVSGVEGEEECVRSKPRIEWWSQKLGGRPMRALRAGGGVLVEDAILVVCWVGIYGSWIGGLVGSCESFATRPVYISGWGIVKTGGVLPYRSSD